MLRDNETFRMMFYTLVISTPGDLLIETKYSTSCLWYSVRIP
jgi:hypothetical protein